MNVRRWFGIFAVSLGALVPLSAVAFARREPVKTASVVRKAPSQAAPRTRAATPEPVPRSSPFAALPSLRVSMLNTRETLNLRLYDDAGNLDADSAQKLDALLVDARDPDHVEQTELDRRTLKLLFRAAYHFHAKEVEVVSAYRKAGKRREGLHAQGRAIDFKLPVALITRSDRTFSPAHEKLRLYLREAAARLNT